MLYAALLCLTLAGTPVADTAPRDTPLVAVATPQARAEVLVRALAEGRFEEARADFDARMCERLPVERLRAAWNGLAEQLGRFRAVEGFQAVPGSNGATVVVAEIGFEKSSLEVRVTVGPEGRISGLFFSPRTAAPAAPAASPPPPYADTTAFTERALTVGAPGWPLPATLTLPKGQGPFPAVVLVHGSGPHDRDATIGGTRVFRDLAWGLAVRGIAVLRYEKRTRAHPARVAALGDSLTVQHETVDDAVAALAALRSAPGVDGRRSFVLGHSLGAMLAPRIAAADGQVAGMVLMAAPARPLEDVILSQLDYLAGHGAPSAALERAREQAARVKSPALSLETPADSLLLGLPASYWLDLRGYDPVRAAVCLGRPILVLQGERDYQVTHVDYETWHRSGGDRGRGTRTGTSIFRLYPQLNHLFVAGTGPSTPDEYARPGYVAPAVIDDVAAWIAQLYPG